MKFKTFRMMAILGGGGLAAAALGGGWIACGGLGRSTPAPTPTPFTRTQPAITQQMTIATPIVVETPNAPSTIAAVPASTPSVPLDANHIALRSMDTQILARAKQPISGDKVKDAIAGQPWKVNLYHDAGASGVNRLKVDLNRNEKWDEKWTFKDGAVEREVAPADDEKYTETWVLDGNTWAKKKK